MHNLLNKLQKLVPGVLFEPGEAFFWSPEARKIVYQPSDALTNEQAWALIHEVAHAQLAHTSYHYDSDLIALEVEAWQKAQDIARNLGQHIDADHIQDCLDTYRDWLHLRSTCPSCRTVSIQVSSTEYKCHNCSTAWAVSASRFCRPYRIRNLQTKKSPEVLPQTTFRRKLP